MVGRGGVESEGNSSMLVRKPIAVRAAPGAMFSLCC